ncbi:MAG TPA: DUF2341 domain-containing protein [Polyangia bacterium]|nr:DUF2341 domain-containing protein [Polyangia bacterium]
MSRSLGRSLVSLALSLTFACSSPAGKRSPGGGTGGDEDTGGATGTGGKMNGTGGASTGGKGGSTGGASGGSGGSTGGQGGGGGNPADAGASTGGAGGGGGGSTGSASKTITIDTTAAGANVMADVPKFPVAVVLNAMNFDFTKAKPKGEDVRFAGADGAALPYEIELWDATAKVAAIWVKVDVKGNSKQTIKMTFGDASAADASDGKKVFDVADGYLGVWHLSEAGSTAAGTYKDSTANANHGKGIATTAESVGDGRVGKAASLVHAMNQWIEVDVSKTPAFDMPEKQTWSAWIFAKTHTVSYQCMLSKAGEKGYRFHYFGTSTTTETCIEDSVGGDYCPVENSAAKVVTGKWYHFFGINDKPMHGHYINAVRNGWVGDDNGTWISDKTLPLTIGQNASSKTRSFDGLIDEVRVWGVAKTPDWGKLEYENTREGQKLVVVGD